MKVDGTIADLADTYRRDPWSTYHALNRTTRTNYNTCINRIVRDCGQTRIADINASILQELFRTWVGDGHFPMARNLMKMLRTLLAFGAEITGDAVYTRAYVTAYRERFPKEPSRAGQTSR